MIEPRCHYCGEVIANHSEKIEKVLRECDRENLPLAVDGKLFLNAKFLGKKIDTCIRQFSTRTSRFFNGV